MSNKENFLGQFIRCLTYYHLLPNRNPILPIPERNKFYCEQDSSGNGFKILNHKKNPIYEVRAKTVVTRSHYRVVRIDDKVAVASVDQGQMASTYTISDEMKNTLAEIIIHDADQMNVKIANEKYQVKITNRSKLFEFYNSEDKLVLTIDKKLIALSDKYVSSFVEDFPALVAALLPVVLDDFFHSGTSI